VTSFARSSSRSWKRAGTIFDRTTPDGRRSDAAGAVPEAATASSAPVVRTFRETARLSSRYGSLL
jgi:hypothetical protein